jgi:uncharacterized protein
MEDHGNTPGSVLDLLDWKRQIFALYTEVRTITEPEHAWHHWRSTRDELFRTHPQSPLPGDGRADFVQLSYFPYDPDLRVTADVVAVPAATVAIGSSGDRPITFRRFGEARFPVAGGDRSLPLYWLEGYGGGLFLPFQDGTSGDESYGGCRYLLDTVKGADLGVVESRLVLDFNFAYNPSCAYDPRWLCPLSPPANRLAIPIRAGEQLPE